MKDWREISEKNCVFQCNNDLKYESKVELKIYSKNKLDRLKWPPYSSDLNSIKNIWGIVKQLVNKWDLLKISKVNLKVKAIEILSEL